MFDPIASTVRVVFANYNHKLSVADPCAGEGAALVGLAERWVSASSCESDAMWMTGRSRWQDHAELFGCELEAARAEKLRRAIAHNSWGVEKNHHAHGDAFLLQNDARDTVHLLWLNPPYDTDRDYGRLEERWLLRFTPMVAVGGALLFFVPFASLAASARTLARHFKMPRCFRLPGEYFKAFKQVVLVAERRQSLAIPDPEIEAAILEWAADAETIDVLPPGGLDAPVVTVSTATKVNLPKWIMGAIDLDALIEAYKPWHTSDRAGRVAPIPGISPRDPFTEIMAPRVRLAVAPRPAHIALAAGAGVLSGARLIPDHGKGPELLLKGVHRRTYQHVRFKENADGERIAEERRHVPELQLSILDLGSSRYHKLKASMDPSGAASAADWTVGDLLEKYGTAMLGALRDRCDILYDGGSEAHRDTYPLLPISPDPLMDAQAHAVRGLLRLLDEPDRAAVLLGQIGVGKTRISLTAAAHRLKGRGRILVMCPPILLPEWESEVSKVLPNARVVVLDSVEAVDREAAREPDGITVLLLSKEAAKLGSSYEGMQTCSKCGTSITETREKVAARRLRCSGTTFAPANNSARIAAILADRLGAVLPQDAQLQDVVRMLGGRILTRAALRGRGGDWRKRAGAVRYVIPALRRMLARSHGEIRDLYTSAWMSAIHALADEALIVREARALFFSTLTDRSTSGTGDAIRDIAARALLLLPPSSPWIEVICGEFDTYRGEDHYHHAVRILAETTNKVRVANEERRGGKKPSNWEMASLTATNDKPHYGERAWGSDAALSYAIERITAMATWTESEPCGEPLYQATPKPRRIPVAQYILKRQRRLFDFLIIDEIHQFGHGDSAQSRAAQQLLCLRSRRRLPVIGLTGSVMNGYARSLFVILWHFSSAFRREYAHNGVGEFERRFGFLVQVIEEKDRTTGERIVYGSQSDRVITNTRTTGTAPGVLPTAVLRYLLPISVTIQLVDLEQNLPPCTEQIVYVDADVDQGEAAEGLQSALLTEIAASRWKAGLAGKLFGPLGHLPRYLDHATNDTGNWPDGSWTIAYPEGLQLPSGTERIVVSAAGYDPERVLPKEAAMLRQLDASLSEGRNVVIATTRTALAYRLHKLAAERGKAALLEAKKVSTAKRRGWIDAVRAAGTRVLIANPAALPVGLNNLAGYFSDVFMFDDPNNDPTLLRQFRGRFVRIGQTSNVRIFMFLYADSLQDYAHGLLQKKRVIAEATDGLDASAAFEVAGIGDALTFETDLGKAIYSLLRPAT